MLFHQSTQVGYNQLHTHCEQYYTEKFSQYINATLSEQLFHKVYLFQYNVNNEHVQRYCYYDVYRRTLGTQ